MFFSHNSVSRGTKQPIRSLIGILTVCSVQLTHSLSALTCNYPPFLKALMSFYSDVIHSGACKQDVVCHLCYCHQCTAQVGQRPVFSTNLEINEVLNLIRAMKYLMRKYNKARCLRFKPI